MSRLSRFIHFYTDEDEGNGGGGDPGILKTVTGTLLHITDALAKPAKKFVATLSPIQDLHGQDAPYPSGGGENVLDPNLKFTTQTNRGVTLTTTDGYNFTVTGTGESGTNTLQTNGIATVDCIVMPAGTYTVSSRNILSTYHPDGSWYSNRSGTFTSPEDFIVKNVYREIGTGTTYNTSGFLALAKGSTAPSAWSPYSNICPITGHTGANVVRTGKNLLNPAYRENLTSNVRFYYANGDIGLLLKANTSYTLSVSSASAQNQISEIGGGALSTNYGKTSMTYTPTRDVYVKIDVYFSSSSYPAPSGGTSTVKCQLEASSTATTYEPYTGQTIPITFPDAADTVYGGTLTNESGEWKLIVDRAGESFRWGDYSGTDLGNNIRKQLPLTYQSTYTAGTKQPLCNIAHFSVNWASDSEHFYTSGTTANVYLPENTDSDTIVQVVYWLATPIEYTLSESQALTLLKGTNNVFCDASDDLEMQYYAKAEETP